MKSLFGRLRIGPRTNPGRTAFALDLTTEAIILHERSAQGHWRKFASVRLDDSEFPIVIGLLRDEAEALATKPQPVRIWLPHEQVLKLRTRIRNGSAKTRLRASFEYIKNQTSYRPEDVAIAVSPADQHGETTLLITFAETRREAIDCATRWGFIPGELSTRHHCSNFGAEGPVFHLKPQPPRALTPKNRRRMAISVLTLLAVAGGTAVWSSGQWGIKPGAPDPLPDPKAVEVASAPPATPPPNPAPTAASESAPVIQASPPRHFPSIAEPGHPADTDQPPRINTALKAPKLSAPVYSIATPLKIAAAPGPTPRFLASPPRQFPNSPAPETPVIADQPPGTGSTPKATDFSEPVYSITAPTVIAAAPSPLPDPEPEPPERDTVVRWTESLAELKSPGAFAPPILLANFRALTPHPNQRETLSLIARTILSSEFSEPAPIVELPPAEPVEMVIEAIKPISAMPVARVTVPVPSDVVEWAEPYKVVASARPAVPLIQSEPVETEFAPLPVPIPVPRPGRADPVGDGTDIMAEESVAIEEQVVAIALPVPRPSNPDEPDTQSEAKTVAAATGVTATNQPSGTQTPSDREDPDQPTKFASATSPLPSFRPPGFADALRGLTSPASLRAFSAATSGTTRSAATEPGPPEDATMLVGILNFENGRKALLRFADGNYRYVIVGDVLDGWRVSLIGVDAMRITRGGEEQTLLLINR